MVDRLLQVHDSEKLLRIFQQKENKMYLDKELCLFQLEVKDQKNCFK